MSFSRRDFLTTTALGSLALGLDVNPLNGSNSSGSNPASLPEPPTAPSSARRPIIVCANNGFAYLDRAYDHLSKGGDTLDSAILVVTGPEDDPKDDSVGLGGLPNEEGVVELDACCMHGPTRRIGRRRSQYQERFQSFKSRDGAHRARHAGGRGCGALCSRAGLPSRKPAHRALAQDLVAMEGVSLERRLVGARAGGPELATAGYESHAKKTAGRVVAGARTATCRTRGCARH